MKNYPLFISLLFPIFLGITSQSWAARRPSFMLDHSAWHATDIVIASEGDTVDGNLTVHETWKGHLAPGNALSIPDLDAFASKEARTIKFPWKSRNANTPPIILSGRRMILFLKHPVPIAGKMHNLESAHWQPASFFREMRVSVAWVEQQHVYAFTQIVNPGPSLLMSQGLSEEEMKERVSKIEEIQGALAEIAADANPGERANDAAEYVHSDIQYARKEAFRILAECKAEAVPVLRSLLSDEANSNQCDHIVDALASAGGAELGLEFTELVEEELKFWKARAPFLKVGWWKGTGLERKDVSTFRNRYSKILHVLYGLRKMQYEDSIESVRAFRDYWRSLPQLEDKTGLDQMSQTCDAILKTLNDKKETSNKSLQQDDADASPLS
jgi:hypothetical protein